MNLNLTIRRYKNRRVNTGTAWQILLTNIDSVDETVERMFSLVRQSLKDEHDKTIDIIKENMNSAKQKALTRMR
jgi:hypothetical protein